MLEGAQTEASIEKAIETAKQELKRLDKKYHDAQSLTGSICHNYIRDNITVTTTQVRLEELCKSINPDCMPKKDSEELAEFNQCITELKAALRPGEPCEPYSERDCSYLPDYYGRYSAPTVSGRRNDGDAIRPNPDAKKKKRKTCGIL